MDSMEVTVGDVLIENGESDSRWRVVQIVTPYGGFPHVRLRLDENPRMFKLLSTSHLESFCRHPLSLESTAMATAGFVAESGLPSRRSRPTAFRSAVAADALVVRPRKAPFDKPRISIADTKPA